MNDSHKRKQSESKAPFFKLKRPFELMLCIDANVNYLRLLETFLDESEIFTQLSTRKIMKQ